MIIIIENIKTNSLNSVKMNELKECIEFNKSNLIITKKKNILYRILKDSFLKNIISK